MKTVFLYKKSDAEIQSIIAELSAKKVAWFVGNRSFEACGAADVFSELIGQDNVLVLRGFQENPTFSDIQKATLQVTEFEPDLIVAVGGGTVLDIAKAVSLLCEVDGLESASIGEIVAYNYESKCPLIACPTTAGTGSEATQFSVVYDNGKKYSLDHPLLLPDYSVIDSQFTEALGKYQTAVSGIDAFSQALESYWSNGATEESMGYAMSGLERSLDVLEDCVNNPSEQSRKKMAEAAHMSGKAIQISRTTAPHALSYTLTIEAGISHGQGVFLILPSVFEYTYEKAVKESKTELVERFNTLFSILNVTNCVAAKKKLIDFGESIGLKSKLEDLVDDVDVMRASLVEGVNVQRLKNHPVELSVEDLEYIVATL